MITEVYNFISVS